MAAEGWASAPPAWAEQLLYCWSCPHLDKGGQPCCSSLTQQLWQYLACWRPKTPPAQAESWHDLLLADPEGGSEQLASLASGSAGAGGWGQGRLFIVGPASACVG